MSAKTPANGPDDPDEPMIYVHPLTDDQRKQRTAPTISLWFSGLWAEGMPTDSLSIGIGIGMGDEDDW